jgi:hypothetical protein
MRRVLLSAALVFVTGSLGCSSLPEVMSTADLLALPRPEPDHRLAYGPEARNFGELRLPGELGVADRSRCRPGERRCVEVSSVEPDREHPIEIVPRVCPERDQRLR